MESIRQSYVNTVNELNQELLVIKEQCEQLDAEKEFLNRELEKRSADANQERVQQTIGKFLSSYGIEK
jgi:molecular chaperone GrpE (heat shock protein)